MVHRVLVSARWSSWVLIASSLIAAGCVRGVRSSESGSGAVDGLAGRWASKIDGLQLDLRRDGTFTVTPPAASNRAPISGRWAVESGTIELRNDASAAACPDVPGRYRWSLQDDGSLVFDLIADECPPRQAHMDDGFTRIGS